MDIAHLQAWIGRTETLSEYADEAVYARLGAVLDHSPDDQAFASSGTVPPLGHWLNFLPSARQSELGPDGHPHRGGFLPPVPLPRRMWAGGRLQFARSLASNGLITRHSIIKDVTAKTGSTGSMVFVVVRHEISDEAGIAITEEQDIVYREMPGAGSSPALPSGAPAAPLNIRASAATRTIMPDPVLLFRYSALTFNAHRIHYDRDYARDVEAYPGLVVHGPLIATLLLDHFRRETPGAQVTAFSFRAQRPLFDGTPFSLCLERTEKGADLWTQDYSGHVTMTASLEAKA